MQCKYGLYLLFAIAIIGKVRSGVAVMKNLRSNFSLAHDAKTIV